MSKNISVKCPYCGEDAEFLSSSKEIYGRNYGHVYICRKCKAWVGCHKGTKIPLGLLANKKARLARSEAHKAFDSKWKSGKMTRSEAYSWLAGKLNIPKRDCHIAMFDMSVCLEVVNICFK